MSTKPYAGNFPSKVPGVRQVLGQGSSTAKCDQALEREGRGIRTLSDPRYFTWGWNILYSSLNKILFSSPKNWQHATLGGGGRRCHKTLFEETWDLEVSSLRFWKVESEQPVSCAHRGGEIPKVQLDRDTLTEQILRKQFLKIKEKQCLVKQIILTYLLNKNLKSMSVI